MDGECMECSCYQAVFKCEDLRKNCKKLNCTDGEEEAFSDTDICCPTVCREFS